MNALARELLRCYTSHLVGFIKCFWIRMEDLNNLMLGDSVKGHHLLTGFHPPPPPFFCDEHVHPDRNKLIAMSLETGIVLEHIKELDEKTNNFPEGSMGTHKLGKLGVHLQFSFETINFNFFSVIDH